MLKKKKKEVANFINSLYPSAYLLYFFFFQNYSVILFLSCPFNNIPKPAEPTKAKSLVLLLVYHQHMLGALKLQGCNLLSEGGW